MATLVGVGDGPRLKNPNARDRGGLPTAQKLLLIALFIPVAFGHWGARIGAAQFSIYLLDFVFFAAIVLSMFQKRRSAEQWTVGLRIATITLGTLVVVSVIRRPSGMAVTVVRDLLPLIVVLFIPQLIRLCEIISLKAMMRVLRVGTLIHCVWYLPLILGFIHPVLVRFPLLGSTELLGQRNDWSSACMAIGIIVWSGRFAGLAPRKDVIVFLTTAGALQPSKIGVVLVGIALLVAIRRNAVMFTVTAISMVSITFLGTQDTNFVSVPKAVERAQGALKWAQEGSLNDANTTSARLRAWRAVLESLNAFEIISGKGAGPDVVREGGALEQLGVSDASSLRAPHNFAITLLMRFGVVGLLAWTYLVVVRLRQSADGQATPYRLVAVLVIGASLVGVILENMSALVVLATAVAHHASLRARPSVGATQLRRNDF